MASFLVRIFLERDDHITVVDGRGTVRAPTLGGVHEEAKPVRPLTAPCVPVKENVQGPVLAKPRNDDRGSHRPLLSLRQLVVHGQRASALRLWGHLRGLPARDRSAARLDPSGPPLGLRDLRGRVKGARVVVSGTPWPAEILAEGRQEAARWYARSGFRERMFRRGVPGRGDGGPDTRFELRQGIAPR